MERAFVYARQSFGSEVESVSIDVQLESCRKWAKEHQLEVAGEYADYSTSSELYPLCDEGIKAAAIDKGFIKWQSEQLTKGRKKYKEALGKCFDDIKTNPPKYLIVYTRNRLGRTCENSFLDRFLTSYLMEHRVSLVIVQDNSIQDFSDKLMRLMMELKDSLDYMGVAEKRRASMESIDKRINSFRTVAARTYAAHMTNGEVVFDDERSKAVRFIFDSFCGGATYTKILNDLNDNFRGYVSGKQWYYTNIYHCLDNPLYCGYMRNRAKELGRAINVPSPIISFAQWSKAQEIRKTKKMGCQHYNVKGESRHWLPFSGYLYCSCGRRMQMELDHGIVYKCVNPDHVMRIRLNAIRDYDFRLSIQALFMIHAVESRKRLESYHTISKDVDDCKAEIEACKASLKAKMRLIQTDDDVELYKDEIDACKTRMRELKERLIRLEAEMSQDTDALQAKIDTDFHNLMENQLLSEEDYQRLLYETIDRIIVNNDDIDVVLKDGRSFKLPRIQLDRRGTKVIPMPRIWCFGEDDNLDHIAHVRIEYGDTGEVLFEDDSLTIVK